MIFGNCDFFDTQMKNKFNEDLYYIEYYDMLVLDWMIYFGDIIWLIV